MVRDKIHKDMTNNILLKTESMEEQQDSIMETCLRNSVIINQMNEAVMNSITDINVKINDISKTMNQNLDMRMRELNDRVNRNIIELENKIKTKINNSDRSIPIRSTSIKKDSPPHEDFRKEIYFERLQT